MNGYVLYAMYVCILHFSHRLSQTKTKFMVQQRDKQKKLVNALLALLVKRRKGKKGKRGKTGDPGNDGVDGSDGLSGA